MIRSILPSIGDDDSMIRFDTRYYFDLLIRLLLHCFIHIAIVDVSWASSPYAGGTMPLLETIPSHRFGLYIICLTGWVASWAICYRRGNNNIGAWGRSSAVSNINSVPLVALAILSLLRIIPEAIPWAWSSAFFTVDTIDAIIRRDAPFFAHGAISLFLNITTEQSSQHAHLRFLSRGYLTEFSTPFLNRWKRTHTKRDYVLFFVAFTGCRVIWVPWFAWEMKNLLGADYIFFGSCLFYIIQMVWYSKMIPILLHYKVPDEMKSYKKQEEENKKAP
mmetsp:Transcript_15452/g.25766  ORF Transcript_15452/g.25766 Transcript_15452/m.25766 type:complete len:276 (-) Transcript_15452:104-931(-)